MGAPTKFRDNLPGIAERLAAEGRTPKQIAELFDIARSTFYNWMDTLQDFSDAITRGRERATDLVEAAHFKSSLGFYAPETKVFVSEGRVITEDVMKFHAPDVRAQMNWLRNHRPNQWAIGESGPGGGTVVAAYVAGKTFHQFCVDAGYPPPYEQQCLMRDFIFEDEQGVTRLMLGSRGYGKTDYVTILGTAFKIYEDPTYRVLVMTKSDDKNKAIVAEISKALQLNGVVLEADFTHHIRVKGLHGKNHSVEALTINSTALRGHHPDLVIMDDPVTEDDVSEATRNKTERKYSEIKKLCANVAIIGQPVHMFDLYETLRHRVVTKKFPHGTIPELDVDLEALELAGVSKVSINASYHLEVSSETGSPFAKANFVDALPEGQTCAFIDPSQRGGDYTAMSVGRGYLNGFAVQGYAWKRAWFDCIPEIVKACKDHKIIRLVFEVNALGMQPLSVLRQALKAAGLTVSVVGWDSSGFKHARIMAVGPFAKYLHLVKKSEHIYLQQTTKYEYGSKFDDAPDSLAGLLESVGLIKGKGRANE